MQFTQDDWEHSYYVEGNCHAQARLRMGDPVWLLDGNVIYRAVKFVRYSWRGHACIVEYPNGKRKRVPYAALREVTDYHWYDEPLG